jgi:hypothetical protein
MKQLTCCLAFALTLTANPLAADELAMIKADLATLLARVEALEAENRQLKSTAVRAESANSLKLKGDIRYRYESIDVQGKAPRDRNRVRSRVALTTKLLNDVEIGIGLASGSSDPTSSNQTLGGGGSSKGINLDLAYFSWNSHPNVSITAGKYKNNFYSPENNGLLWDGDYNPEGVAITYDNGQLFSNFALHWLDSDSINGSPRAVVGLQAGYAMNIENALLTFGAGLIDVSAQGQSVFRGNADAFFGNSFTCVDTATLSGCTYNHDYEQVELFAHLKTKIGDSPFVAFVDYVNNRAADDLNAGWSTGFTIGKASAPGTWQIGYIYADIEADAVFKTLADSDFGGGVTDSKGHVLKGSFAIDKNWKVGISYFDNVSNVDLGADKDYNRIQFDTALKF